MIATLLLAAGQSTRMQGCDKLLEQVGDQPVLALLASRALAVGPVYVTLPSPDHPRCAVLPLAAKRVIVHEAQSGMSASLRAGIAALPDDVSGVIILPADMPDITQLDLAAVKQRALDTNAPIIRAATPDGRFGHPTYFAASQFPRFAELTGDRGGAVLFKGMEQMTQTVTLQGDRAVLDLDTPEDWEAYRRRQA
ncbi:MAG: nucleotidyltransferase family protein [Octadecabacter sp.]|nr:nucleotidyltransferase family protein [Octadecabacter sp.]